MTLGLNNDSLQLRTRIKSSLSLSTFTLTLFRVTATNIPISRLLSHRDIYFPSWRHRVFFSGFGAREYWKYSVSLPFALLFLSRSDTFRKPEYFLASSETRTIYFLSWPSSPFFTISKETLRTHIRHDSFLSRLLHIIDAFYFWQIGNFWRWQKWSSESGNEKRGLNETLARDSTFQPRLKR